MIKITRSRSLFKALDLICICKPITWSYIQCEEAKKHKMSAVITSSSLTCCEQKDTFASPSFMVIWIAVLFQSFEWSLLISNRLKPKFFEKLSDATPTGINWAFKLQHPAVGISYFRKPHLHVKQHEVVIWCELIVARLGVTMRHNVKQSCAEWMVRQLLLHSL